MADSAATSLTKMKKKKKKIKAFHQKKKLFRAQDPKISVLMWGICHSVRGLGFLFAIISTASFTAVCNLEEAQDFGSIVVERIMIYGGPKCLTKIPAGVKSLSAFRAL